MKDPFICRYCKVNTFFNDEYYMIHGDLWRQVNLDKLGRPVIGGMLCIGCVEEKLGRRLNKHDFPDISVNDLSRYPNKYGNKKSSRLIDRIMREP